jgi:hypothetical protein
VRWLSNEPADYYALDRWEGRLPPVWLRWLLRKPTVVPRRYTLVGAVVGLAVGVGAAALLGFDAWHGVELGSALGGTLVETGWRLVRGRSRDEPTAESGDLERREDVLRGTFREWRRSTR